MKDWDEVLKCIANGHFQENTPALNKPKFSRFYKKMSLDIAIITGGDLQKANPSLKYSASKLVPLRISSTSQPETNGRLAGYQDTQEAGMTNSSIPSLRFSIHEEKSCLGKERNIMGF